MRSRRMTELGIEGVREQLVLGTERFCQSSSFAHVGVGQRSAPPQREAAPVYLTFTPAYATCR